MGLYYTAIGQIGQVSERSDLSDRSDRSDFFERDFTLTIRGEFPKIHRMVLTIQPHLHGPH